MNVRVLSAVLSGIVGISAGGCSSLAYKVDGTTWVWGDNASGQLGDGTTANRLQPVQGPSLPANSTGGLGGTFCAFFSTDGSCHTWGDNASGQLCLGDTLLQTTPQPLVGFGW